MSDLTFGELRKVVNSNTMVNSLPPMKGRSGQSPLISGMGYMKSWLAWHSVQSLWYTNEHPTNYVGIFCPKSLIDSELLVNMVISMIIRISHG